MINAPHAGASLRGEWAPKLIEEKKVPNRRRFGTFRTEGQLRGQQRWLKRLYDQAKVTQEVRKNYLEKNSNSSTYFLADPSGTRAGGRKIHRGLHRS